MRRFWIGIVILTVTLGLGVTVSVLMPRLHKPIEQKLCAAQTAAEQADWASARAAMEDAAALWQRSRCFVAAVADHEPMESIDVSFAQALAFLQQRDTEEFSATVAGLREAVWAMANSQSIVWWNFL